MRPPWLAWAGLALAYGAAAAVLDAGPDLRAWAAPVLLASLAFALGVLGAYLVARLAARDPEKGFAISRNAAIMLLVPVGLLGFLAGLGPGLAFSCGLGAGWLGGRPNPHGSDVALLGAVGLTGLGVWLDPSRWDDSALFLVPTAIVALALAAREAWDLHDLRENARVRAKDAQAREATQGSWLLALGLLAGATLVAYLVGLTRDAWRGVVQGDLTLRVVAAAALLGSIVALAWLFLSRQPKRAP